MKNKLLTLAVLSFTGFLANAQVGIHTAQAQATLDVVGFPTNTAKLDGIIAPRLTGNQLRAKTYTSAQNGALVYITAADSAPAGQTINVTAAGYYYFNGTVWVRTSSAAVAQPTGWYTAGNSGTTASTAAVGSAVSSGNFLGTTDAQNLVITTNNTVKGILDTDGNLKGGNANASGPYASLAWGSNNTLSNNTSSNIALGRENTVAAQGANFPGVAVGANNTVTSGAKVLGNGNFVTGSATLVVGNGNGTSGNNAIGITVGNSNTNTGGYAFGTGNNVSSNNYAFGNANVANSPAGAIAVGFSANAVTANQTVYANNTHAFSGQGALGTAITDVGINVSPSATNIADLEVSKGVLIKITSVPAASDCNAANEGTIVYGKSGTTGNFYGCKQTSGTYGWQPL